MDVWLGKISTWTTEANAVATAVNSDATDSETSRIAAEAAETSAISAKDIALSAANFSGSWSSLTGALSMPASVTHNDLFWVLLTDLVDITASEPSESNADWQLYTILPSMTSNSGKVLTNNGTNASWTSTLSGLNLTESSYDQIADASLGTGTHTFDYSSGDMQQLTATGDITLAFSNFPTGKVASMIIDAVNFGAHTITHPSGIVFEDGIAPYYTVSGIDRLLVVKDKDDVYSLSVIIRDMKVAS
jgi:hypothetical protein